MHKANQSEERNNSKTSMQLHQENKSKKNIENWEDSLSKELESRKSNIHRKEKMRQLLWETSPELKELRQKLLIASVTKDQAMQIAEKQATMELSMQEDEALAEKFRRDKKAFDAEERRKEIEDCQAKKDYKRDLDELRHFKKMQESLDDSEQEKERNAIDDIKKQIEEEAIYQTNKQREKQIELRKQMDELLKVRDEIRLQEKLADQGDGIKAEEYRKLQDLRAKEQEEKKQLSLKQKLEIQEELLSYLEKLLSEKARKELLRIELAVEERHAKEKEKDRQDEKQSIKIRKDLQRVYEMQINVKKQREDLQKKEEELYRKNMMANLYEEDKLELMSQQKKHLKKLEHMRIVQSMIEESHRKKVADRATELSDRKHQEKLEVQHTKAVNEEKIRFLKECAGDLLGYLPKRMFEDKETVEMLGEDFTKFYGRNSCSS